MNLAELSEKIKVIDRKGDHDIDITGLHYDSRKILPGNLFIAIEGYKTDGHLFIQDAVNRGARAVVLEKEVSLPPGVACLRVENSRKALGMLAGRFYNYPSRDMRVIGVTGTNGKTTTTHLIKTVLEAAGRPTGLIGTIGNYFGDLIFSTQHTTPESLDLQVVLRRLADMNAEGVVIEISSHALALERTEGTEFDGAVFTNLTQDHLDFHKDMADYFNCKAILFKNLGTGFKTGPKYAVINIDDPYGKELSGLCKVPVVTYGIEEICDVRAHDVEIKATGLDCRVTWPGGAERLSLRLTGMFNVYNVLAAFAVALKEGVDPRQATAALGRVTGVPGRFEQVGSGQPFAVVVDYAHTPDGLENLLRAARQVTGGRLIVVFGCGGDRDKGKRPLMGEIAARLADHSIITSDNPRNEDPDAIISHIIAGAEKIPGEKYTVIPERRQAIAAALKKAGSGDMVVIAGKGHETYQIIKNNVLPFDDRQVALEELRALGYTGSACNAKGNSGGNL